MTKPIPTLWRDGDTRVYANQLTGRTIEARCENFESYKVLRIDKPVVLYHSSSPDTFRAYLRGELEDYSLKLTSHYKGIYKPIMR